MCKGPEVGVGWTCLRKSNWPVWGISQFEGRVGRDSRRKGSCIIFGLVKTRWRPWAQSGKEDKRVWWPFSQGHAWGLPGDWAPFIGSQRDPGKIFIMSNVTTLCLAMITLVWEFIGGAGSQMRSSGVHLGERGGRPEFGREIRADCTHICLLYCRQIPFLLWASLWISIASWIELVLEKICIQ